MRRSFAEHPVRPCPYCGVDFSFEVWVFVDALENPELVERIRAGNLHVTDCPHCGKTVTIDAPLLLYRPREYPKYLFCCARESSTEQDREQAAKLLSLLREQFGAAWEKDCTVDNLPRVPRGAFLRFLENEVDPDLLSKAIGPAKIKKFSYKSMEIAHLTKLTTTFSRSIIPSSTHFSRADSDFLPLHGDQRGSVQRTKPASKGSNRAHVLVFAYSEERRAKLEGILLAEGYGCFATASLIEVHLLLDIQGLPNIAVFDLDPTSFWRRGVGDLMLQLRRNRIPVLCIVMSGDENDYIDAALRMADDSIIGAFQEEGLLSKLGRMLQRSVDNSVHSDRVTRSFEFSPDHCPIGLGILAYFRTVLGRMQPDVSFSVNVDQRGTSIHLTVQGPDGSRRIIEESLASYADVVLGKTPPENLLANPIHAIELRQKLQLLSVELDLSKQVSRLSERAQERQLEVLRAQIGRQLLAPATMEVGGS